MNIAQIFHNLACVVHVLAYRLANVSISFLVTLAVCLGSVLTANECFLLNIHFFFCGHFGSFLFCSHLYV